jgi:lysophospholipase L1-like esterase
MLKSFLILTFTISIVGCSSDNKGSSGGGKASDVPPIQFSKPGEGTVKVVGDSLAFGLGASSAAQSLTPTNCLRANFPGTYLNLAKSGATSEDLKNRLDFIVKGPTKMYFVSAGGNDVLYTIAGLNYPEQKTLDDMNIVFDRLLSTNAVVVYLSLNPPVQPPYEKTERLPKITALAQSKGIVIVDGMKNLWADPLYMADDVHPNDLGYEKMCGVIVNSVTPHYP